MKTQRLEELPNLGKTIIQNLNIIEIYSVSDLKRVGPIEVYKRITSKYPKKTWPVCYYLYSIEGALTGKYWDDLSKSKKNQLLKAVGKSPKK